jgi:hypothetical protein
VVFELVSEEWGKAVLFFLRVELAFIAAPSLSLKSHGVPVGDQPFQLGGGNATMEQRYNARLDLK